MTNVIDMPLRKTKAQSPLDQFKAAAAKKREAEARAREINQFMRDVSMIFQRLYWAHGIEEGDRFANTTVHLIATAKKLEHLDKMKIKESK